MKSQTRGDVSRFHFHNKKSYISEKVLCATFCTRCFFVAQTSFAQPKQTTTNVKFNGVYQANYPTGDSVENTFSYLRFMPGNAVLHITSHDSPEKIMKALTAKTKTFTKANTP